MIISGVVASHHEEGHNVRASAVWAARVLPDFCLPHGWNISTGGFVIPPLLTST
jgi:hypothetical protein